MKYFIVQWNISVNSIIKTREQWIDNFGEFAKLTKLHSSAAK